MAPIALIVLLIGGVQTAVVATDAGNRNADTNQPRQVLVQPKPARSQADNPFLG